VCRSGGRILATDFRLAFGSITFSSIDFDRFRLPKDWMILLFQEEIS
jgi:hypothetical protein